MTHLFKVQTQLADLFIKDINFKSKNIVYDVRDKEDGKLMEPSKISKFIEHEGQIKFDHVRFINIELAKHISLTLNL